MEYARNLTEGERGGGGRERTEMRDAAQRDTTLFWEPDSRPVGEDKEKAPRDVFAQGSVELSIVTCCCRDALSIASLVLGVAKNRFRQRE